MNKPNMVMLVAVAMVMLSGCLMFYTGKLSCPVSGTVWAIDVCGDYML